MSRPVTKGESLGAIATTRTIQSTAIVRPAPEVDFDWGPQLPPYVILSEGNSYPWAINLPVAGDPAQTTIHKAGANIELTFTAAIVLPDGDFITEYEWDFGDGMKGYGESVAHTYKIPNLSIRIRLYVTDNRGRRFYRGKQIQLLPVSRIVLGGFPLIG